MNKKIMLIIGVFFLFILFFCILFFGRSTTNLDIKNNVEVNVYDKVRLSSIVSINDGSFVDDYYIDTERVGTFKEKFTYYDSNGKIKTSSFDITIVDKEAPYVMFGNSYTYVIGNKFDLENSLFYGDNFTKRPNLSIDGEYDLNTVGEYPLVLKVSDESGNVNNINFILKVIEKSSGSSSSSSKITFEEINDRLPNNASLMVDVSKWQEDIDWQSVYDSGVRYAMLRMGTQKGIDQDSRIDTYFDKNIKEAQAVGIDVGVYYFSYANDVDDAYNQALWVVDVLKDYNLDLPVAFDWECWNYFDDFNLNFYELNKIADTFLKEIENNGYDTLIYGSKNYIENVWTYLDYDIWLAHYTKNTSYSGPMKMWQFTNFGRVPGIKGNVDVNFYYNK